MIANCSPLSEEFPTRHPSRPGIEIISSILVVETLPPYKIGQLILF